MYLSVAVAAVTFLQFAALWTIIGTTRHQIRAYIYVVTTDLKRQGKTGKFVHHLKAVNTGQTPARNLRVESITKVLVHPVAATFDFSLPEDPKSGTWTVGSGKDVIFVAKADRRYSKAEIKQISNGKSDKRLYSYGTLRYADIFGRNHSTEFCLYFEVNKESPDRSVQTWVNASQYHNNET